MTQTEALVKKYLLSNLADVVLGYFCSDVRSPWLIARAGEYEACESLDKDTEIRFAKCPLTVNNSNLDPCCRSTWSTAVAILAGACAGGHIKIVKYIREELFVIDQNSDNIGIVHACSHGQIEIARMLAHSDCDWDRCLEFACYGDYGDCAALAIAMGATDCRHCRRSPSHHWPKYWSDSTESFWS